MKHLEPDSNMNAPMNSRTQADRTPVQWTVGGLALTSGIVIACWGLGLLPSSLTPHPVSAATKPKFAQRPPDPAGAAQKEVERKVKLNYFYAPWEKVLQDVADAGDLDLIVDQLPAGRFSRRDNTVYTIKDAMRILNREIEPKGVRLIEKAGCLILIDIPRPEYAPAVLAKSSTPKKQEEPQEPPTKPAEFRAESLTNRTYRDVNPASYEESERGLRSNANRPQTAQEPAPLVERRFGPRKPANSRSVRQASHDDDLGLEPEAPSRKPHPIESQISTALEDVGAAAPCVVYKPRNLRGTELAKQIYRAMKSSAELVDSGRNGHPAFRVSTVTEKGNDPQSREIGARTGVEFMISIDEARNELLIDARPKDAETIIKLLKALDRPEDPQSRTHVKPSSKYVCQIADQLPDKIDRIRAARGSTAVARRPVDGRPTWLADENQRKIPVAQNDDAPQIDQPLEDDSALGGVLGNFKGEVNIQVIEDLNVMVIIGNERDVEQIEKLIKQIEQLAEATAPQVHLLHLQNVDSESLAELLISVYEKLTKFPANATQPRESVAIVPISKPNALLIIAPAAEKDTIVNLAEELDMPVDPQTEFEVFRLKSSIATEVETLITEFYKERKALGAKVLVIADPRSNSVIIRARPRDLDEIKDLIRKMDRNSSDAVNLVRIFPLKNAVASEMSSVINAAIQSVLSPPTSGGGGGGGLGQTPGLGGGQVEEQFKSVKSAILSFLYVDKGTSREVKSGILSDIRVTPEARANALIVTASEQSMELMAALIQTLDRPTSTVSEIKVFTLANADAELMVQQLNALFNNQTQGANQARQQLGIALSNADDASSSLVPLKFSVDTRTNSVIAVGSGDALRVVEAIMLRLDESNLRARKNVVYRLKNSPATLIAQSVSQFFQQQRDLAQADPNLISNVEQLEREVIVVPDTVSNSLLISTTPRYFEDILAMIKKLDEMPKQVVIQALIVEVQLNNTDELGIEMGFQSPVLFQRSLLQQPVILTQTSTAVSGQQTTNQSILSQEGTPGFNFNNAGLPLGNNVLSSAGTVGGQSLSNFSVGRTNSDLGFGGLVLSAGSDSINLLLRALAANRKIQILSRPQIRALDNQLAEVFVGQTIPTVTSFQTNATTGVISPTLTQRETGIGMQVMPRINDDGQIVIQMYAYRSQLSKEQVTVTTDSRGQAVGQRITDLSNVRTTVSVPSNSTVVIGGMISSRDESFTRKAPFLGDIPIVGQFFRYDSRTAIRSELLIFLTPRILSGIPEEECLKEIEMGRIHFIESEAEEAHGPLRAVPDADEVFEDGATTPWIGPGTPGTEMYRSSPTYLPSPTPATPTPAPAPVPSSVPSPPAPLVDPNLSQIQALRLQSTEADDSGVTTANLKTTSDSKTRNASTKKNTDRRK